MSTHEHLAQEDLLELALALAAGSAHGAAALSGGAAALPKGLAKRLTLARACPSCREALEREQEELVRLVAALEHTQSAAHASGAKLGWRDALARSADRVQAQALADLGARAGTLRPVRSRALRLVAASLLVHVLALPLVALWIVREQTLRGQFIARLEPEFESFAPLTREPRGEPEFGERDWSASLTEALEGRPASRSRASWTLPSAAQVQTSRVMQRDFMRLGEAPSLVVATGAQGASKGPRLFELEPAGRLEWLACSRLQTWHAARGGPLEGALGTGLRLFEGQLLETGEKADARAGQDAVPGASLADAMELEWALDLLCLAAAADPSQAPAYAGALELLGARATQLSLELSTHLSSGPKSAAESEFLALVMERALVLGVLEEPALGRLRQAWVARRTPSLEAWDQTWAAALERAVAAVQRTEARDDCLRAWLR